MKAWIRWIALAALVTGLAGCQTVQRVGDRISAAADKVMGSKGQRLDPWESWNRKVFSFNEKLDANVLKPVATAYSEIVPSPIRTGIDNFFGNIGDAWSAVNLLMQGRPADAGSDLMRFSINTVFGLGGFIDWAEPLGLERHDEDLGQTLGKWGVGPGPYLVLPLLGPSTLRDVSASYKAR